MFYLAIEKRQSENTSVSAFVLKTHLRGTQSLAAPEKQQT